MCRFIETICLEAREARHLSRHDFRMNATRKEFFRMLHGTFCAEAWDCISRYVYAALQGGSIMQGWTNNEKVMITCCNDGMRPVIFKLERIDEEV